VNKIAAKRNVKPVALLTFDDKVTTRKILGVWFIFSSLRDHIDKQVPSPSLSYLRESTRDRLLLFCGPIEVRVTRHDKSGGDGPG
jgi:hypothetical protein